jgi:hypothetical protein
MPQRGDIVVERLTGKRAIVIRIQGPEEVTCRFADGRLEDRYNFELEPAQAPMATLISLTLSMFGAGPRERPPATVGDRLRPMLVRTAGS